MSTRARTTRREQKKDTARKPRNRSRATKSSPNFTKTENGNRTYLPPLQVERIKLRYVEGESLRQIAAQEGRARQTITKIVRSPEMQEHMQKLRGKLCGFLDDLVDTVYTECVNKKAQTGDARLAYQLLKHFGVIPSHPS
jgi:Helix-turn-helix domain